MDYNSGWEIGLGRLKTDLLFTEEPDAIYRHIRAAALLDLGDWFAFDVGHPSSRLERGAGGIRHSIHSLLDGRTFERFHLDVGVGNPIVEATDHLYTPDMLAFADIGPVSVPCYPVSQQLAEKILAYVQEYASGRSTRVKDFVDLLLLAAMGELSGERLAKAIQAIFDSSGVETAPARLPPPPRNWDREFRRLADEVGFLEKDLNSAYAAVQKLIDPVLSGDAIGTWDPNSWQWKP